VQRAGPGHEAPSRETEDRGGTAERRTTLVLGALLVLLGGLFLVINQLDIDWGRVGWPVFVIVPGIVLFALSFAVGGTGGSGFAVAGGIVTMTGLLLAFQNATGLWATWAYAWTLVAPGGVGAGLLLYALLTGQRGLALDGGRILLVALGLFLGFAFFFESVIGLSGGRLAGLDTLFAGGLVLLGVLVILLGLLGGGRPRGT
jgi:hypothetical protein